MGLTDCMRKQAFCVDRFGLCDNHNCWEEGEEAGGERGDLRPSNFTVVMKRCANIQLLQDQYLFEKKKILV